MPAWIRTLVMLVVFGIWSVYVTISIIISVSIGHPIPTTLLESIPSWVWGIPVVTYVGLRDKTPGPPDPPKPPDQPGGQL